MKYCPSCGKELVVDAPFCDACGTAVGYSDYQAPAPNQQENADYNTYQQGYGAPNQQGYGAPHQQENASYNQYQQGYGAPHQQGNANYNNYQPGYNAAQYQHAQQNERWKGFAIAGLVLGILALTIPVPVLDLILGILAIIFSLMSKSRGGQGGLWVTALVFSIIGTIAAFFYTLGWLFLGAFFMQMPWNDIFHYL